MALVVNEKFVAVSVGKQLIIFDLLSSKQFELSLPPAPDVKTSSKNTIDKTNNEFYSLSTLACSKSLKYFGVTDDSKRLFIYDVDKGWTLLNFRTVPKRCTSMVFTEDEKMVLLADKSGDVHRFSIEDSNHLGSLVVGHVSMLINLALCKGDKYLVTCDRDEKIRVSHYPNGYNIAMFCLGHSDFVSQLVYVEEKDLLLSGSGDGTIILWNYLNGQQMDCLDCFNYLKPDTSVGCPNLVPNQSDADNVCRGVDVMNIAYSSCFSLIAVSFERRSEMLVLRLCRQEENSIDSKLKFVSSTSLPGRIFDLKFSNYFLFVLHVSDETAQLKITCYEIKEGNDNDTISLQLVEGSNTKFNAAVKNLNEKLQSISISEASFSDWSRFNCSLHKMHIDNLSEYVDRKRQRMDEMNHKKIKKQKPDDDDNIDSPMDCDDVK